MSISEIRKRHEDLKRMVSTQSLTLLQERKSQANKDRGELLKLLDEQIERNGELQMALAAATGSKPSVKKKAKKVAKKKRG